MCSGMTKLNIKNKQTLLRFILEFLPPTGNKRKYAGNELEVVHGTLSKLFKKHFNFTFNFDELLQCFEELNYNIYTKQGVWDSEKKDIKPSSTGNETKILIRGNERVNTYIQNDAAYIYIDISASKVRDFSRTLLKLPEHTNSQKLRDQQELLREIEQFKQTTV